MLMRLLTNTALLSLTAGLCAAQIDLLPGAFFQPADFGSHELEAGQTHLRYGREFLLYVEDPGDVTVTIEGVQIGRFENDAKLAVVGPDGAELATASAATQETAQAAFTAPEPGPYTLRVDAGRNAFTLAADGAKVLIPAGAGQPFHGVRHAAPVYLFVPPGASNFTISLSGQGTGETAKAHVLGPDGTEAALLNTTGKMTDTLTIDVPGGADDAVWAVIIEEGDDGVFEDFEFTLTGDVSPYVAEKPQDLLCPAMSASSGKVSREDRDRLLPVDVTLYADLADFGDASLEVQATTLDGDAVWSQSVAESDVRGLKLLPDERLPDGKYRWNARLLQAGEELRSFGGTWWYVPAPNHIAEDGTTLLNGEPFFARGLYHVEPEDYDLVREHGFNVVQAHADNVEAAEAAGLNTGVALYWGSSPGSDAWKAKVDRLMDNESIFAWWIQDEPDARRMSTDVLADCYMYIRERDPDRPAYTCLCVPDTYETYAPQTDIVSIDVYPIGRSPITAISDTLEHAQDVIPDHVHYFIGQIWSWPNTRLVEPEEHRCMTYLSLAHGARGLFWYSFRDPDWYIPDDNPEVWAEMKRVNDELIELEPALLTPNIGEATFHDGALHACAKRVDDELVVIAVNPTDEAVSGGVVLDAIAPGMQCAETAEEIFEERTVRAPEGTIIDEFAPLGVHVYTLPIADAAAATPDAGDEEETMTASSDASPPEVFLIDPDLLSEARRRVEAGDPALQPAIDLLLRLAERALDEGPFTVVDKPMVPPSGDRHDYMSVGPYWWPNPDTDDGLPYVRRDGETNPERREYDNVGLSAMGKAVTTLGLAHFFTGEERYAEHAATLLRTWFLDEETRMNPHLTYGQAIPGRVDGRGIGIIDTMGLPAMLDAVGMLEASEAWTEEDQQGLQAWFAEYLDWIWTHPYGEKERSARNNHGTWYDVQAASYALFTDRPEIAREVLEAVPERRIVTQIEPDGSQPHELARTNSYGYCAMNLKGFFALARQAEKLEIDLWGYEDEGGRSIRNALDWVIEHAFGESEWEHQNLSEIKPGKVLTLLRTAAVVYDEPAYEELLQELADDGWASNRHNLLCPSQ